MLVLECLTFIRPHQMRILLVSIILCANLVCVGQQRLYKKAKAQYENLAFAKAIKTYERALYIKFDAESAFYLANAYKLTQQYAQAERWYALNTAYTSEEPKLALYYAQVLKIAGRYELALEWYNNYKSLNPFDKIADEGIEACLFAMNLDQMPSIYEARKVNINSDLSDFGPTIFDGKLYFTSNRDENLTKLDPWAGLPFHRVYSADFNGGLDFDNLRPVSSPDVDYHEGPISFSPDKKWVATTVNYSLEGKNGIDEEKRSRLKIQLYEVDANGNWINPIDFPYNNENYNLAHPCFSPDGKRIYFSADLEGSIGGADIWYSEMKNGVWGIPKNLGENINTSAEEMFPTIGKEGELYFASNGWGGLGGLDVFSSTLENGSFSEAMNMGKGFNSSRDDFSLTFTEFGKGYFSSNREGGAGLDDIYYFEAKRAIVDLLTLYASDSLPASGIEVTVKDKQGKEIFTATTDENGSVLYPLEVDQEFTIAFQTGDMEFPEQAFNTNEMEPGKTYERIFYIGLQGIESYIARGLVVEDQSKLPLSGVKLMIKELESGEVKELTSDDFGFYVDRLKPFKSYTITATKEGYKPETITYVTESIEADFMLPVIYMKGGKRVFNLAFEHVYFDYDKSNLRDNSIEELTKMLDILKLSPELRVEISAHTDSRGTNAYNEALSDRRAASVRSYLIEKGIDPSRMVSKGYGENRLTNECADGVSCSEEKHQKNRRVEFAVIDENNKAIYQSLEGDGTN